MVTALRSKLAAGKAAAGREEGAYVNRYVNDPAAAHTRQLKRFGLYAEDLSRLVRRSLGAAF
jgi:hypothetical protein